MKWIGNCQLAAGCQFDLYKELWIGNCQLSASCQFDKATIRDIWNELAAVNWQLAANSNSRIGNCQLSACCQFDESTIRAIRNELATVNWQLAGNSISIKNFELATVSQMPFRWSYHKVYMKWIGNCQLAAGCQFDFYQELWIGNCQL